MKLVNQRYNRLIKRIDDHTMKLIMTMLELLVLYGVMTETERGKALRRLYRRKKDEEQCSNV